MKEKIKNYLNQSATKETGYGSLNEYTFKKRIRRTLGSEQQVEDRDKIGWNVSAQNLSHFYSPPKTRNDFYDVEGLLQENRKLKEEVRTLKELLVDSTSLSKTYQKLDLTSKSKKDDQIVKLKKIIQKSYYSIKQLQTQVSRLTQQLHSSTSTTKSWQKKYKLLEFHKQELEHKITNTALIHRQEIEVLQDRIRRLDLLTEQLVEMVEQDQRNWATHMHELSNLKKFYSGRNYQ